MIITFKIIIAIYMVVTFFTGLINLAHSNRYETAKNVLTCIPIIISVMFFILVSNREFF